MKYMSEPSTQNLCFRKFVFGSKLFIIMYFQVMLNNWVILKRRDMQLKPINLWSWAVACDFADISQLTLVSVHQGH